MAAVSCAGKNPALKAFCDGKLHAATYFFRRELPSVMYKSELLMAGDDLCSPMQDDWF